MRGTRVNKPCLRFLEAELVDLRVYENRREPPKLQTTSRSAPFKHLFSPVHQLPSDFETRPKLYIYPNLLKLRFEKHFQFED